MSEPVKNTSVTQREMKKKTSLLRLAWKNVFTYAWVNLKMCFVFACLAFLICLFTSYNMGLAQRRQEQIEESISANYLYYSSSSNGERAKQALVDTLLEDRYEYQNYNHYKFSDRVDEAQGVKDSSFYATYMTLEIDGEARSATAEINAACFGGDLFTKYDLEEMKFRFGYDSCVIGNEPEDASQAALSELLIGAYGLTREDVMGKHISLYVTGERDPFFTGEVSGVVRNEYYQLNGHSGVGRVGVLLHRTHPLYSLGDGNTVTRHVYVLDDWLDLETAALFTQSGFTYVGSNLINWVEALDNIVILGNNLYLIIGSTLAVGLILTVFLMVGKYIKVFSRSSGILLTLGMERKKLYGLLLIQLLIICLLTIPISLVMTVTGYFVINVILTALNNVNMGISLVRLALMFAVGIGAVLAIALLFFAYAVWQIRKQTIKQFLNTEVN